MIRFVWSIGAVLILAASIGVSSSADTLDVERAKEILAGKPGWVDGTPLLRQSRKIPNVDPILKGTSAGYVPVRGKVSAPQATKQFWIIDLEDFGTPYFDMNEDKVLISATLQRTTSTAYLYIENGVSIDPSLVDDLMSAWDSDIYPNVTGIWGPPPDELDGDEHVYLLIAEFPGADIFGGTVVGYFDDANEYTDAESFSLGLGHSNEIEMLYVNKDSVFIDPWTLELDDTVLGILSHEFQHVIHWELDPDEDIWLNEGHSDMAMIATGHGSIVADHTLAFSMVPTTGLLNWDNRLHDYGATFYFFLYLNEHYGGHTALTAIANDKVNGVTAVDNYLRINYGTNIRKVFKDWTIANLLDEATGPYSYASSDNPREWVKILDGIGYPPPYFFTWRDVDFNQPSNPDYPYLEDWSGEYFLLKRDPGEAGQEFHVAFDAEDGKPFFPSVVGINVSTFERTSLEQFVLDNDYAADHTIPLSEDRLCAVLRYASTDMVGYGTGTADYDFRVLTGNGTEVTDPTPPGVVTDLTADRVDGTRIDLSWSAPGDDGDFAGIAYYYDIRASTSGTITVGNWSSAYPVRNVPLPGPAAGTDRCVMTDLLSDQDYWFAMKTYDEVDNESLLSNVASGHTGFPDLTPPATIANLTVLEASGEGITFQCTAPGDDGFAGTADRYEIRYSQATITDANFRHTYIYPEAPAPVPGGSTQEFTVSTSLIPLHWAVSIRTFDEAGNVSGMSNNARGTIKTGVDSWELMGGREAR